jgi:hypothetical protein
MALNIKYSFIFMLLVLSMFSFVSSQPPFQQSDSSSGTMVEAPIKEFLQQGEDWKFHIHAYNGTVRLTNDTVNCTIHLYNPINGGHLIQDNMSFDSNGIDFEYTVLGGNFSELGQYAVLFDCEGSGIDIPFLEYAFYVTPSGKGILQTSQSIAYLSFLLFLFILMGTLYVIQSSINFEKWNNKIISRYENKNYVKLVLSSIGYNLMKNTFIIYYLIGLAALVIITDFVYLTNIVSLIELMPSVLAIYSVGIIIVAIYFFGYVQEWLMTLLNQIKDMDWGMQ